MHAAQRSGQFLARSCVWRFFPSWRRCWLGAPRHPIRLTASLPRSRHLMGFAGTASPQADHLSSNFNWQRYGREMKRKLWSPTNQVLQVRLGNSTVQRFSSLAFGCLWSSFALGWHLSICSLMHQSARVSWIRCQFQRMREPLRQYCWQAEVSQMRRRIPILLDGCFAWGQL